MPNQITQLETFARAGFAARGIVYLLLGYFAWTTGGGEATSTVMGRLHELPLGTPMLFLLAFGLFGYGLFRLYGAWMDLGGKGSDAKGLFARTGPALSGLAHFLLAATAIAIALDIGGEGGSEGGAADAALELPGGALLVALAGIVGIAAGIGNFYKAWTCAFMKDLDSETPQLARWSGRAGYAARGIVFALVGWQIIALAIGWGEGDPGMESALTALRSRDWLFPLVALGLALFGLFSFIMARRAQIRNEDVLRRLKTELGQT